MLKEGTSCLTGTPGKRDCTRDIEVPRSGVSPSFFPKSLFINLVLQKPWGGVGVLKSQAKSQWPSILTELCEWTPSRGSRF